MVGDSGVGKTNMLGRWMTDSFSYTVAATLQSQYVVKTFSVSGKLVRVNFWDTGTKSFSSFH
jgi:GTPase SAR1 family protein